MAQQDPSRQDTTKMMGSLYNITLKPEMYRLHGSHAPTSNYMFVSIRIITDCTWFNSRDFNFWFHQLGVSAKVTVL